MTHHLKAIFPLLLDCNRHTANTPHSIYQYSNMAPRLSGQTSIFGAVFFVFESLLGIERQKKLKKFTILTRKLRSHVRILIYRTWPITTQHADFQKVCIFRQHMPLFKVMFTFVFVFNSSFRMSRFSRNGQWCNP